MCRRRDVAQRARQARRALVRARLPSLVGWCAPPPFNQLAALSELHACNCWQLFNNHPVELEKIPKKVKLVGAPKDLSLKLLLDA